MSKSKQLTIEQIKKLPGILEIQDLESANRINDSGIYRAPTFDGNRGYIFIKKVKYVDKKN